MNLIIMDLMNYPEQNIISITEYNPEYQGQVIEMILEIQQKEYGISISAEEQPDLKSVYEFYQQDGGNFWIALSDGTVAGTIALKNIGNKSGALRKMFVKAEYRGGDKSVASGLLSTLIRWSSSNEYRDIYLGTTEKFKAAHRFYEKNGFEEILKEQLPESFPVMAVDSKFYHIGV
jgi:N-acetylglutamate synthase-like GNAT family acetyltransferase